jgi:uncharacterized protein DUF5135
MLCPAHREENFVEPGRLINFVFIAVFLASAIWLYRGDRAAGHARTVTWMFIGATSMSWLEAVWDWTLYYRFNPEQDWLMPAWIPVLGMAGGWPYVMPCIYGPWFVLCTYFFAKKMVDRNISTGKIVGVAVVVGAFSELVLELPFLFIGNYSYTRSVPGFALFTGTQQQYPLLVAIYMAPVMAFFTIMMVRGLKMSHLPVAPANALAGVGAGGSSVPVSADGTAGFQSTTFWSRLGNLRAFGGQDDRVLVNLVASTSSCQILFALTMLPALAVRFAGWAIQVGSADPFGVPAYPFPF